MLEHDDGASIQHLPSKGIRTMHEPTQKTDNVTTDQQLQRDDRTSRPVALDEVEARLPIPADVLVVEQDDLPSGDAWWSPAHRVILLRPDLGSGRRFALAHECAHILLGHHAGMPEDVIEPAADALAAKLLVEAEGLAS